MDTEKAETLYENEVLSFTFQQLEERKPKELEVKERTGAKAVKDEKS